jgi:hypothetical protein
MLNIVLCNYILIGMFNKLNFSPGVCWVLYYAISVITYSVLVINYVFTPVVEGGKVIFQALFDDIIFFGRLEQYTVGRKVQYSI